MIKDYGEGRYLEKGRYIKGRIIIEENRLYVSGASDYVNTYIPLEKIEKLKRLRGGLEVSIKFSAANIVRVIISLPRKNIHQLTEDLVMRLHLKKKFLKREWSGEIAWR